MKKSLLMVGSLLLVCLVSAAALSWVYSETSRTITARSAEDLTRGLRAVLAPAVTFEVAETAAVWIGKDALGNTVGIVFRVAPQGYGGPIPVLVGLDCQERVSAIRISTEGLKETPGLGLKVTEPWFQNQFKGRSARDLLLRRDGGRIDAVAASTISSRAVTDGVRAGIEAYRHYLIGAMVCPVDPRFPTVLPGAARFIEAESARVWIGRDTTGAKVGIVFAVAPEGYAGPIPILVGARRDGTVTGIWIASTSEGLKETAGLGARIRDEKFTGQFLGKKAEALRLRPEGSIEAITGATISSRAAADGIRRGLELYGPYLEGD